MGASLISIYKQTACQLRESAELFSYFSIIALKYYDFYCISPSFAVFGKSVPLQLPLANPERRHHACLKSLPVLQFLQVPH